MPTESPLLRLTVWRPCRWEREYLDLSQGGSASPQSFQEAIYSWELFEDVYGSILKSEETEKIRNAIAQLYPTKEQSDFLSAYSIERLRELIALIDTVLAVPESSTWSTSATSKRLPSGERLQLLQHPLLAVRHHLQWIYDTFSGVPDVIVTLR